MSEQNRGLVWRPKRCELNSVAVRVYIIHAVSLLISNKLNKMCGVCKYSSCNSEPICFPHVPK